jgi:predicted NACHT family NTPase
LESNQLTAEVCAESIEQQRQAYYQQPIYSVLEIINDPSYQYTVILGDPGSGKSTLLQYILLNWVESPTPMIPLLIELRKSVILLHITTSRSAICIN